MKKPILLSFFFQVLFSCSEPGSTGVVVSPPKTDSGFSALPRNLPSSVTYQLEFSGHHDGDTVAGKDLLQRPVLRVSGSDHLPVSLLSFDVTLGKQGTEHTEHSKDSLLTLPQERLLAEAQKGNSLFIEMVKIRPASGDDITLKGMTIRIK